jgi:hypothetical protein
MPDLSYKITTSAELSGAQAAADALERQIGKAKALKQDYSELQKQLDTVNQSLKENAVEGGAGAEISAGLSDKTREYIRTLDGAGESMVGNRQKAQLLHLALRNMGGQFPELGMLAHLFFNPALMGFAAAAAGIELLSRHIANVNARQLEMINLAGESTKALREIVSARPTETASWESWLATMTAIEEKLHGIAQELASDARFAKNFADVTKGVDANKTEQVGKLGLAAKADAERAAITDQIAVAGSARGQAQRSLAGLGDEGTAVMFAQSTKQNAEDFKKQIENLPKAIAADQAFADRVKGEGYSATHIDLQNRNSALDRIDQNKDLLERAKAALPEAEKQAASAAATAEAFDTLRKSIQGFSDEIIHLQNQKGVLEDRLQRQAPAIAADTGKREFETATNISARAEGGGKVTGDEQQFIMRAANEVTGHTNTFAQAVQLFEKAKGDNDALLARMMAVVEKQDSNMTALFRRVQDVEGRQQAHQTQ